MPRAPLLALVLVAAGCASAEGAYKDGMALETAGRYEDAARAYATALQRDPDLPNVRGRLVVAGREAVARRLQAAVGADDVAAADHYLAAAALLRQSDAVGVALERPATFDEDLGVVQANAVGALLDRGYGALDAGAFADALGHLDAARRYAPGPDHRVRLDAGARDVYTAWAEADRAAGRYAAAVEHADAALGLAPPGTATAQALQALRADVIREGTVVVAVFPAEPASARAAWPRGFLRDLDDAVEVETLANLPALLAVVPSLDVRRLLRAERDADDRAEHPRVLAGLARDLGADVGLAVEAGGLDETETDRSSEARTARTRRGGETVSYTRVSREIALSATGRVVAVDARTRDEVCDDEVGATTTERYTISLYDGDASALDLSRADRDLFDPDVAADARARAYDALRDRLAEALARRAVTCIQKRIR